MVRYNGLGMAYNIVEDGDDTLINEGNNTLRVKQPIARISQDWYRWQHMGILLQNAFPYLNANEREFLLTGLTEEDWERIFPEGREDE